MFSDRVHPGSPSDTPSPPSSEPSLSPRSSASSSRSFIPKLPPPPGDYFIQVKKDLILRVPPPENAHFVSLYAHRSPSRRFCNILCCLASLSVLLFLAAAAAAAIVLYFVYHPKEPAISIDAVYVRNFNLTAAAISPEFVATVRALNPNKRLGIHYLRGGEVTASYGEIKLGDGSWPGFYQERRNVTVFDGDLTASGILLSSAIREDLVTAEQRRQVPLLVDASVPIKFKAGAVSSWTITVKLRCDVTVDRLTPASKIVSQSCRLKMQI